MIVPHSPKSLVGLAQNSFLSRIYPRRVVEVGIYLTLLGPAYLTVTKDQHARTCICTVIRKYMTGGGGPGPNRVKKGAEVGRGKASRTSSTPSEPRLRECSGSLSDLLWYLTPCNGARSQSVKCQVYVHTSMPPHINTQIHIKVLPFIRNQQCLIGVVDGSGEVGSFFTNRSSTINCCYILRSEHHE